MRAGWLDSGTSERTSKDRGQRRRRILSNPTCQINRLEPTAPHCRHRAHQGKVFWCPRGTIHRTNAAPCGCAARAILPAMRVRFARQTVSKSSFVLSILDGSHPPREAVE